jgi:hypothetical protein
MGSEGLLRKVDMLRFMFKEDHYSGKIEDGWLEKEKLRLKLGNDKDIFSSHILNLFWSAPYFWKGMWKGKVVLTQKRQRRYASKLQGGWKG